jgi:hypothetical protein
VEEEEESEEVGASEEEDDDEVEALGVVEESRFRRLLEKVTLPVLGS